MKEAQKLKDKLSSMNRQLEYLKRLKTKTLNHLGGPTCTECGYDNPIALSIDHIHNDGAQERRKTPNAAVLRRQILKMPQHEAQQKYQVLCRNCNWIKQQTNFDNQTQQRRQALQKQISENQALQDFNTHIKQPFGLDTHPP
jgi:hypothetical protein